MPPLTHDEHASHLFTTTPAAETTTRNPQLIQCIRQLVEAERGLTEAIERSQPLLSPSSIPHSNSHFNVGLPTPRNMDDVNAVLALARTYSSRTSAPPSGWDPTMPVLTFATPNPLPHQLRGGALGAMQLNMARLERSDQEKRKLQQEQKDKERQQTAQNEAASAAAAAASANDDSKKRSHDAIDGGDPSKSSQEQQQQQQRDRNRQRQMERQRRAAEERRSKTVVDMNLSETSSSEEEDDDDEEEESD